MPTPPHIKTETALSGHAQLNTMTHQGTPRASRDVENIWHTLNPADFIRLGHKVGPNFAQDTLNFCEQLKREKDFTLQHKHIQMWLTYLVFSQTSSKRRYPEAKKELENFLEEQGLQPSAVLKEQFTLDLFFKDIYRQRLESVYASGLSSNIFKAIKFVMTELGLKRSHIILRSINQAAALGLVFAEVNGWPFVFKDMSIKTKSDRGVGAVKGDDLHLSASIELLAAMKAQGRIHPPTFKPHTDGSISISVMSKDETLAALCKLPSALSSPKSERGDKAQHERRGSLQKTIAPDSFVSSVIQRAFSQIKAPAGSESYRQQVKEIESSLIEIVDRQWNAISENAVETVFLSGFKFNDDPEQDKTLKHNILQHVKALSNHSEEHTIKNLSLFVEGLKQQPGIDPDNQLYYALLFLSRLFRLDPSAPQSLPLKLYQLSNEPFKVATKKIEGEDHMVLPDLDTFGFYFSSCDMNVETIESILAFFDRFERHQYAPAYPQFVPPEIASQLVLLRKQSVKEHAETPQPVLDFFTKVIDYSQEPLNQLGLTGVGTLAEACLTAAINHMTAYYTEQQQNALLRYKQQLQGQSQAFSSEFPKQKQKQAPKASQSYYKVKDINRAEKQRPCHHGAETYNPSQNSAASLEDPKACLITSSGDNAHLGKSGLEILAHYLACDAQILNQKAYFPSNKKWSGTAQAQCFAQLETHYKGFFKLLEKDTTATVLASKLKALLEQIENIATELEKHFASLPSPLLWTAAQAQIKLLKTHCTGEASAISPRSLSSPASFVSTPRAVSTPSHTDMEYKSNDEPTFGQLEHSEEGIKLALPLLEQLKTLAAQHNITLSRRNPNQFTALITSGGRRNNSLQPKPSLPQKEIGRRSSQRRGGVISPPCKLSLNIGTTQARVFLKEPSPSPNSSATASTDSYFSDEEAKAYP